MKIKNGKKKEIDNPAIIDEIKRSNHALLVKFSDSAISVKVSLLNVKTPNTCETKLIINPFSKFYQFLFTRIRLAYSWKVVVLYKKKRIVFKM